MLSARYGAFVVKSGISATFCEVRVFVPHSLGGTELIYDLFGLKSCQLTDLILIISEQTGNLGGKLWKLNLVMGAGINGY